MKELLGLRHGKVESWFMKANAPDGRSAFWTKCTVFRQRGLPPVAEAWAVAFDKQNGSLAIKSTVAFESARFADSAFDAEVDGCRLDGKHAHGALASGRGTLAWDLAFGPSRAAPIRHFPTTLMYRDELPPFMKLVTPIADARARGRVDVNGDAWNVEDWPMMTGHNWGRGHPELYAWVHGNAWSVDGEPANLAFEAISGRIRTGPLLTPMTTLAYLRYRGQSWDLSSPRALTANRGTLSLRRWEMTTNVAGLEIACDIAGETDDIVGLHYPNPSGPMTYCLATMLARGRLDVRLPSGESFTATTRAAALEVGTNDPDHGIRMVL